MKTWLQNMLAAGLLFATAGAAQAELGYGGFGFDYQPTGCGCNVPVATHCCNPVVHGDPGFHYGAGAMGCGCGTPYGGYGMAPGYGMGPGYGYGYGYGYGMRQPIVSTKVYYPMQPVRNVIKAISP